MLFTMLQKSPNSTKYPCDSFWEVWSHMIMLILMTLAFLQGHSGGGGGGGGGGAKANNQH